MRGAASQLAEPVLCNTMQHLRAVLLWLLWALPLLVLGTHNRAAEITLCFVGDDNTLAYEITIITYTKTDAPADRPEFVIDWGDTQVDTIQRDSQLEVEPNVTRNVYSEQHVYSGTGTFTIVLEDPNRIPDVVNIDSSVDIPICVRTQIKVVAGLTGSCSPQFLNLPIQDACVAQPWVHNPGAFDVDGDSLAFEAIACLGFGCQPIPGYVFPNEVVAGSSAQYGIDPFTGTISWVSPEVLGVYNLAFKVTEYRYVPALDLMEPIGFVIRDMQVDVKACNNLVPEVKQVNDTCLVAGSTLLVPVSASDPDVTDDITLSAFGQPLIPGPGSATFTASAPNNPASGQFAWNTNCSHVRLQPYQVNFQATDDPPGNDVPLVDVEEFTIRVIAPPVTGLSATPSGAEMLVQWSASQCTNAIGYALYRRQGPAGYVPGYCETGVPAYTGYQQIAELGDLGAVSYTDANLLFGVSYCYVVIALFEDGSKSIASEEVCAFLERALPVITKVSVGTTDMAAGLDTVHWTNASVLDTIEWPGPYLFKLYGGVGFTQTPQLLATTPSFPFLQQPDTTFLHSGLNTLEQPHAYAVELYSRAGTPQEQLVGKGNTASSLFLSIAPNDEQLALTFSSTTPWVEQQYEVYRDDGSGFALLATTTQAGYVDTGLVNGKAYCYYVVSSGTYDDTTVYAPLVNYSQRACAEPVDLTPPCVPELALDTLCAEAYSQLFWTNPATQCGDTDAAAYHVYFADSASAAFVLVARVAPASDTLYLDADDRSIAGCWAVTSLDSVGNESIPSNVVCADNCPNYVLPNVFTPDGSGRNDLFVPFPNYRGVSAIEMRIFDRWGVQVFSTTDPGVLWDGTFKGTNEKCADGVYFYTCSVTFARLAGNAVVALSGYVHLLGGGNRPLN
jgi:gliding motility-associated-like protein